MHKGRMEAFSDGVFAIIITIMVLELKVPHGDDFAALLPVLPVFVGYMLSFVLIGIYWANHHHLLQVAKAVDGRVLWANMLLLFWLSLLPFATGWLGESQFAPPSVTLYGVILLMAAVSYTILVYCLIAANGRDSTLAAAIGGDTKGKLSLAIYATSIAVSFAQSWIAFALFVVVAVIWFIPDKRIERKVLK